MFIGSRTNPIGAGGSGSGSGSGGAIGAEWLHRDSTDSSTTPAANVQSAYVARKREREKYNCEKLYVRVKEEQIAFQLA